MDDPVGPTPSSTSTAQQTRPRRLRELALVFLKLGTIAFGGPAGHLALMEDEFVRRRGWLSRDEFLDLLGASNLIPGPTSTEMGIYIGQRRAGGLGLLVAGCCFILPAAILVTAIAWAYQRFGRVPQVNALLYGVKPVVIAILIFAFWRLCRTAVKSVVLAVIGVGAAVANFFGGHELLVLFGAGVAVAVMRSIADRRSSMTLPLIVPALPIAQGGIFASIATPAALWPMFLIFLKIGAVLFGGGYVLVAFLRADFVYRFGWLSESQLLDAVAVGQFTPGPLFTTATFIGYILAGIPGAAIATVAIFLPGFIFVAISGPFIPRLRKSRSAAAFLDGLNVAALALLAVVSWQLARAAVIDWPTVLLAAVSLTLLIWARVNSAWLVLGGAIVGITIAAVT